MQRRISVKTYRAIDCSIFALMLLIFENLIVRAARFWYPDQLYTVSVVAAVTAIIMMRWGWIGLIHAVFGGLVTCFASGANSPQYIIYCAGNLGAAFSLLFLRLAGKDRVHEAGWMSLAYAVVTQVSMQAGRAAVAILTGTAPAAATGFFTTDSLSILFTMLILWIARRQDGLLEDQLKYLHRVHEQERMEREEQNNITTY